MDRRAFQFFLPLASLFLAIPAGTAANAPDRYIVELSTPSVSAQMLPRPVLSRAARARLGEPAATAHRTRIRGEQSQLRARLEQRRARVLGSVDTVANAMFVELTGENARERLAAMPGVKRVLPMREFHRVMDNAVLLHKITDVWARMGEERAGEGVKVAIIDTGVEVSHPAMQAGDMQAPEGFPRANGEADLANTNGKVIVARSYVSLLRRDPDLSARDRVGHGTALATIVAGVRTAGPLATTTGVAPKAWVGSYKVFGSPNSNDSTNDAAVLKAIEDAVADGMDVINLSIGSDFAPRLAEDVEVQAIENASRAGVVVVVAAGNNGPGMNTLASPGSAPLAITVGAVGNSRTFASSLEAPGLGTVLAVAGSGPAPGAPVTAAFADVASLDGSGLACEALPPGSLSGRIAVILRGSCLFEIKLNNADKAGAVAAVVYAAEAAPEPFSMSVGAARLPAEMIAYAHGVALRKLIAEDGDRVGTLSFALGSVPVPANRRSSFSAAGPNVDLGIKPDMVAAGADIYTATQRLDRAGDMYSADGFVLVDGTSFSSPIVAGAVALIKSARPGLTVDQYRSLIINNTADAYTRSGDLAGMQVAGSGSLDALASLNAIVTAYPTSLGFGSAGAEPRMRQTLSLTNLGAEEDTFVIDVTARREGDSAPVADTVSIGAGATAGVPVIWNANGLAAGTHEGLLLIRSVRTGSTIRVPYWYSVASSTADSISVISAETTGRANRVISDAVLFRVLDSSGVNVAIAGPAVTVVAGDGEVRSIANYNSDIPGLYGVSVRLGLTPGVNTFQIEAAGATYTFNITGQ